jgi:hypothetical protein
VRQAPKLKTLKPVQEDKTHKKLFKFVSVVDRRRGLMVIIIIMILLKSQFKMTAVTPSLFSNLL